MLTKSELLMGFYAYYVYKRVLKKWLNNSTTNGQFIYTVLQIY